MSDTYTEIQLLRDIARHAKRHMEGDADGATLAALLTRYEENYVELLYPPEEDEENRT